VPYASWEQGTFVSQHLPSHPQTSTCGIYMPGSVMCVQACQLQERACTQRARAVTESHTGVVGRPVQPLLPSGGYFGVEPEGQPVQQSGLATSTWTLATTNSSIGIAGKCCIGVSLAPCGSHDHCLLSGAYLETASAGVPQRSTCAV